MKNRIGGTTVTNTANDKGGGGIRNNDEPNIIEC